jgi:hypothetical protein
MHLQHLVILHVIVIIIGMIINSTINKSAIMIIIDEYIQPELLILYIDEKVTK